ncbi:hypothetical protein GGX14DRAFT_571988 [Mycena pura]|uniref:Uncharacterized protein n=1 Tax=Mycena pura TaxID=153505 RepID=A0AAD6YBD8_9AGAR|nr:hypothetical protein GGX14DRAFT_571988 [Mycena pura]
MLGGLLSDPGRNVALFRGWRSRGTSQRCLNIIENIKQVLDFKVKVEKGAINTVRALYAPKDHEVFQLAPPDFGEIITQIYIEIEQPPITRAWRALAAAQAAHNLNDAAIDAAHTFYVATLDDHEREHQHAAQRGQFHNQAADGGEVENARGGCLPR